MDTFYFDNTNGILTLKNRALDAAGFEKHCFTTRIGGVSRDCFAHTNLSFSREDRQTVEENYRRIANAVGFSSAFVLTKQEHTATVQIIDSGYNKPGFITMSNPTDGLVTNEKGVCLTVFVADCVPVLIADKRKRAVAAVHSGWRGTAKRITARAVELMRECYGSRAEDMIACIGPCIGKCCYEVGGDVYEGFGDPKYFEEKGNGKYMLDLNLANMDILKNAGVGEIHVSYECTYCKSDIYYSHRKTNGKRGNLAAMIEI